MSEKVTPDLVASWRQQLLRAANDRFAADFVIGYGPDPGRAFVNDGEGRRLLNIADPENWDCFLAGLEGGLRVADQQQETTDADRRRFPTSWWHEHGEEE